MNSNMARYTDARARARARAIKFPHISSHTESTKRSFVHSASNCIVTKIRTMIIQSISHNLIAKYDTALSTHISQLLNALKLRASLEKSDTHRPQTAR